MGQDLFPAMIPRFSTSVFPAVVSNPAGSKISPHACGGFSTRDRTDAARPERRPDGFVPAGRDEVFLL
jgi:hypothetical protein